jgi:hypothetical protein
MPVGILQPDHKVSPFFPYPPSGRVRVYLEADHPVDVFISTPEQAAKISSVKIAAEFAPGVLIYNSRWNLNEIITIPKEWMSVGWSLTIGHPGPPKEPIAVYYAVYPA